MLVYNVLGKHETRRMQLVGLPTFLAVGIGTSWVSALWVVPAILLTFLVYSFVYTKTWQVVAAQRTSAPDWKFYGGAVLVQLVCIVILLATVWA